MNQQILDRKRLLLVRLTKDELCKVLQKGLGNRVPAGAKVFDAWAETCANTGVVKLHSLEFESVPEGAQIPYIELRPA